MTFIRCFVAVIVAQGIVFFKHRLKFKIKIDLFHCLAIFDATIECSTTSSIHSARYVFYWPIVRSTWLDID